MAHHLKKFAVIFSGCGVYDGKFKLENIIYLINII